MFNDAIAGSDDAALRAAWPQSHERLPAALDGGAWVVKPRRGYGGAGVVLYDSGSDVPPNAQGLAQRYVPSQLEGRAWSLRAYLIVRADGVYLSRIGVVRFAVDGSITTNAARAVLAKGRPTSEILFGRAGAGAIWDARTWPRVHPAARGVARLARERPPRGRARRHRRRSWAWTSPSTKRAASGCSRCTGRRASLEERTWTARSRDAVVDAAWGLRRSAASFGRVSSHLSESRLRRAQRRAVRCARTARGRRRTSSPPC